MTSVAQEPLAPGPQEAEVLQRRAALLARPRRQRPPDDLLQTLEFTVAGQPCAIELAWLREVRVLRGLAHLPHAAQHVLGVVHLRGRMLPVLDLADMLGLESVSQDHAKLVVLGRETAVFGFPVAQIEGLSQVSLEDLSRRSVALEKLHSETIRGVTAAGRLLLNGSELLASRTRAASATGPGPNSN